MPVVRRTTTGPLRPPTTSPGSGNGSANVQTGVLSTQTGILSPATGPLRTGPMQTQQTRSPGEQNMTQLRQRLHSRIIVSTSTRRR